MGFLEMFSAITPLVPEVVLFLGSLGIVLLGVLRQACPYTARGVHRLVQALFLFGIVWLVFWASSDRVLVFGELWVSDGSSNFLKILCLLGGWAAVCFLGKEHMPRVWGAFEWPVLVLWAVLGMMVMLSAHDLMTAYLGLELQSLALYLLVARDRDRVFSLEAGLKYFVLGALSSGLLLYGASLLYGTTGETSFSGLKMAFEAGGVGNVTAIGVVFFLAGLLFKISAVPFHMWTPDAYEGAPLPVTGFLASAAKIAAVGLFLRVLVEPLSPLLEVWQPILAVVAVLSVLWGALSAIGQRVITRLLAYSSIGHMGYVLLALSVPSREGVMAVLFYLGVYFVTVLGVFACLFYLRLDDGKPVRVIDDLAGLSSSHPKMAFLLSAFFFSLAGVPPLAGFFSKYLVFLAALKAGLVFSSIFAVLGSVIGAFYYLRLVKMIYMDSRLRPVSGAFSCLGWGALFLGWGVVLFAFFAQPYWRLVEVAARSLL